MPNVIHGTPNSEAISGTDGDDLILGHEGDDFIDGLGGDDTLIGGEGDDFLGDQEGNDLLLGGEGADILGLSTGDDTAIGGAGNDHFNVEAIFAPSGHDELRGGDGIDTVDFGAAWSVDIDLGAGTFALTSFQSAIRGDGSADGFGTVSGVERVFGTGRADRITGDAANNVLLGQNGNDTITGGLGNDELFGDEANDTYIFNVAPEEANADFVFLFSDESQTDTFALDRSVMPELGDPGQFSADDERFYAAAGATGGVDEDDRVIYDTDTGRLYYDLDGSGTAEALLIATVEAFGPRDLEATNIAVI